MGNEHNADIFIMGHQVHNVTFHSNPKMLILIPNSEKRISPKTRIDHKGIFHRRSYTYNVLKPCGLHCHRIMIENVKYILPTNSRYLGCVRTVFPKSIEP